MKLWHIVLASVIYMVYNGNKGDKRNMPKVGDLIMYNNNDVRPDAGLVIKVRRACYTVLWASDNQTGIIKEESMLDSISNGIFELIPAERK